MSGTGADEWMTIGELARRSGVTPDLLRVWERRYGLLRPRRTAGNQRLFSRADAMRVELMRRRLAEGAPAAKAAELVCATPLTIEVGTGPAVPPFEAAAAGRELRRALGAFEESAAQRVLERLLTSHTRLAVIRDVLLPFLRDVGDRWAQERLSVAQEHFASAFVEARFLAMARGWDRGPGPRALLACPAGERHTFGLLAFGIALHERGWRITCLGADTPVASAADAAAVVVPELVVLAACDARRFADEAPALAALARRRACALGGAGATAEAAAQLGARHLAGDPVSAAATVAV